MEIGIAQDAGRKRIRRASKRTDVSEYDLYSDLMIEATRLGHRLFRNNVGRARYKSARGDISTVPYGVGGKGGSDLVGWTVSNGLAIFTAIEVKGKGGIATDEQKAFINAVLAGGGIAGVVRSVDDYRKLVGAK